MALQTKRTITTKASYGKGLDLSEEQNGDLFGYSE